MTAFAQVSSITLQNGNATTITSLFDTNFTNTTDLIISGIYKI
jgi:hypothetical protein